MVTIALAGKGGTGKTTVAALTIRHLMRRRLGTVLAIDADPATNLNLVLVLPSPLTVGDIREDMIAGIQNGSVHRNHSPRFSSHANSQSGRGGRCS